jgi:hypothetical protein
LSHSRVDRRRLIGHARVVLPETLRRLGWAASLAVVGLAAGACSRPRHDGGGSSLPATSVAPTLLPRAAAAPSGPDAPSGRASSDPGRRNPGAAPSDVEPAGTPPGGKPDTAAYPWHADPTLQPLAAVDRLQDRFASPQGFSRVPLAAGSFGAWLRDLPLAALGTPVLAYDGRVLRTADDPRVAAVATLDVGKADLQQCADAVIRLHAEWSWSRDEPKVSYRAASGTAMPWERWARGERVKQRGQSIEWVASAGPSADHAAFRRYLDAVFSWANTVSLARQAKTVSLAEVRPGDFMILPGGPGHSVLVLDMASALDGKRLVLLGQSYMPAQSYHVLRPTPGEVWFTVDPDAGGIQTPFWPDPFPWSSLRRLD